MGDSSERNQMIPFLSIASQEFERDLDALKSVLSHLEKRTHIEKAYRLSERGGDGGWLVVL